MRHHHPLLMVILVLLALTGGCQEVETNETAVWEKEIMQADRAFAAEVAAAAPADRATVWAGWFAPSGIQIVPSAVIEGHEAISSLMDPFFASAGFVLTWDPDRAKASPDGLMGWTSGRYENRAPDGTVEGKGRYLTLWERQADGIWKVDLDTGVPDPGE